MYKYFILSLLLFGCRTSHEIIPTAPSNPLISFFTLFISKEKEEYALQLVNRKDAAGTMKKSLRDNFQGTHALKLVAYSGKQIVDSLKIEHPLYKHIESQEANGTFFAKDTVLNSAKFTVRFQTTLPITEIKSLELTRNESVGKWITLKL